MSGIIRRVDGAGRVVIPMSIRRRLDVQEGSNIEFAVKGNVILFRKCTSLQNLDRIKQFIDCLYKWDITVVICHEQEVLYAPSKSHYYHFCTFTPQKLLAECQQLEQSVRSEKIDCNGEKCELIFIGRQNGFEKTACDYIATLICE